MFRVTPVPENSKERKVSFSPDIDESYRHQAVDKIKTLMDEVSVSWWEIQKTVLCRANNNFSDLNPILSILKKFLEKTFNKNFDKTFQYMGVLNL